MRLATPETRTDARRRGLGSRTKRVRAGGAGRGSRRRRSSARWCETPDARHLTKAPARARCRGLSQCASVGSGTASQRGSSADAVLARSTRPPAPPSPSAPSLWFIPLGGERFKRPRRCRHARLPRRCRHGRNRRHPPSRDHARRRGERDRDLRRGCHLPACAPPWHRPHGCSAPVRRSLDRPLFVPLSDLPRCRSSACAKALIDGP
jgi:hypothetical protein